MFAFRAEYLLGLRNGIIFVRSIEARVSSLTPFTNMLMLFVWKHY